VKSSEQFKQLLLSAKSLAYPPTGTVGEQIEKIAARFDLAEEVAKKTKPEKTVSAVASSVASGEAEFGFAPKTVLLQAKDVRILGDFPPELQTYIIYVAAVDLRSIKKTEGRKLIDFLTSRAARDLMAKKGFDVT
jgi:molybdate transport system substrate-binding protein